MIIRRIVQIFIRAHLPTLAADNKFLHTIQYSPTYVPITWYWVIKFVPNVNQSPVQYYCSDFFFFRFFFIFRRASKILLDFKFPKNCWLLEQRIIFSIKTICLCLASENSEIPKLVNHLIPVLCDISHWELVGCHQRRVFSG